MTIPGPITSILPGGLPGEAASGGGTDNSLGIFAALLSALDTQQPAGLSGQVGAGAGLFAQQSLIATDIPAEARPDLAAALGVDVEVFVAENATQAEIPAEIAVMADPLLAQTDADTKATTALAYAPPQSPAAQTQSVPAPVIANAGVVKPVDSSTDAAISAETPDLSGVANAPIQGNDSTKQPAAAAISVPEPPAPAIQGTVAPLAVPKAKQDASIQATQTAPAISTGNITGDGDETASARPAMAANDGDAILLPTPSNRPVLVHVAAHPLTAQTLVTAQESPSADTTPLGATGGAAQTVHIKAVSAPPPPIPGSLPAVPLNSIAVHIAQQAQTGARRFDIRLDPPELGRIDVRLEVNREGHVHTHLVVERSETLDLLQRDARQLERALQDAGLDTSQGGMKFTLKEHGAGQQGGREGFPGEPESSETDTGTQPTEELVWQGRAYTAAGGLDIRI